MSLLVTNINFQQAIRSIREVVLDTSPVQCFNVSGQDFSFKKDVNGIVIGTDSYTFSGLQKQYDLLRKLRAKEVAVEILPDYVAVEVTTDLVNFDYAVTVDEKKLVERENYFSDYAIQKVMEEFFAFYTPYDGMPKTIETMFNNLEYMWKRKMILWVAYYLIDKKRMNYASVSEMIRLQNGSSGDGCTNDSQFKNVDTSITTRVGEVFSVTEKDAETGKGFDGFTDFWGDKFGYFTKLQLYIRSMFEKQFQDYSLRDDCMISQSFSMEKTWQTSAWIDTFDLSDFTRDVLQPSRD